MAKGSKRASVSSGKKRTRGTRPEKTTAPESNVMAVRMISAKALKDAVKQINSILETNSEHAGAVGEIKRAAQEKGMDGVALGLLVRLWRKGQNNAVKLRQILDGFDYGRDALKLDDLKAADMLLDEEVGKRRSKKDAAEIDPNQRQSDLVDAIAVAFEQQNAEAVGDNVHSIETHRRAEAK